MADTLHVLLIEDSASDADLVVRQLKKAGYSIKAERVETAEELRSALTDQSWDLVLADYQLPQFDAPAALSIVQAAGLDVPFIVISGTIGEELAVAMMRAGAHDYLMKDHLARLAPAVDRELAEAKVRHERRQAEAALRQSEAQYRQLIDQAADGIFVADPQGNYIDVNRAGCEMLGYTREEILRLNMRDLVTTQDLARQPLRLAELKAGQTTITVRQMVRKDGTLLPVEISGKQLADGRLQGIVRDVSARLQAEEALRRSEEALQATLDGLSAHIANLDEAGNIIVVNAAWRQFAVLNGLSASGYGLGQNYLEICDRATGDCSDEAAAMAGGIRDVLTGQRDYFYLEYPCHSPSEQRWFAARVTRFQGAGPARVVVAHENITVRVLAEQRLRQRVSELTAIHRASQRLQDLLSLDDLAAEIIGVLEQVLGYSYGAILLITEPGGRLVPFALSDQGQGRDFVKTDRAYLNAPDLRVGEGVVGWVAQSGESVRLSDVRQDQRYRTARPDVQSELCVPLKIGPQIVGVINVESNMLNAYSADDQRVLETVAAQIASAVQNARLFNEVQHHAAELEERVTERTTELAHERERLRAILDAIGEGVVFTNQDGTIEYINPAMERLTGYAAREALSRNPRIWQSDQTPPALYNQLWSTITRGELWQGELLNRRHDGTLYDASLTVAPLLDSQSRILGFVGVQRDITHQKELDRLKDQFVSNVSHELRTPLTSIMLNLDLLEHGKLDKRPHYQAILRRETVRLKHMIEDLLDLSRLDRHAVPIELQPIELGELASQLVADRVTVAAERGLTLTAAAVAEKLPVLANASKLTQVISNLLTNALNYTPAGGQVSVRTERQRLNDLEWITLTVNDTGPGISTADLPHLFERFYRGEVGRRVQAPGTGLGLAISKSIMDQLDGQITVQSKVGQGAAFTLWLKPA